MPSTPRTWWPKRSPPLLELNGRCQRRRNRERSPGARRERTPALPSSDDCCIPCRSPTCQFATSPYADPPFESCAMRKTRPIEPWCEAAFGFLREYGFRWGSGSTSEPTIFDQWSAASDRCSVSVLVDWRPSGEVVTEVGPPGVRGLSAQAIAEALEVPRNDRPKESAPTPQMVERRIHEHAAFLREWCEEVLQGDFSAVRELLQ